MAFEDGNGVATSAWPLLAEYQFDKSSGQYGSLVDFIDGSTNLLLVFLTL